MSGARAEILARIKQANGRGGSDAPPPRAEDPRARIKPTVQGDVRQRFEERARLNLFTVHTIASLDELPSLVAELARLTNAGLQANVAPALKGLPWPSTMKIESARARMDERLGVTRAKAAIAETGTLVLGSDADAPSGLNFAPETSVLVVDAKDIVPYLEDGLALARKRFEPWPRVVNMISGPSRTADVAGIVVRPAHGPKQVHLVIVG